jgi:VCBS repeat protein
MLGGGSVKKMSWQLLGLFLGAGALAAAIGCSEPKSKPVGVPLTPTPQPMSRTNPNIVEEDALHFVERFPKDEYIKVDERHIRNPVIGPSVEFYKEDDKYYYVYTYKRNPEADELSRLEHPSPTPRPPRPGTTPTPQGPKLSEFEDLAPERVSGRMHLQAVSPSGLPEEGLWRASFQIADMNGDGIPDVVAPPSRLGDGKLHVWIGDGKGHFSEWPIQYIEDGKPNSAFSLDYGGVAVGDIDGDGNLDVVAASHSAGLVSLFGDGKGTFRVVRAGLPRRDFSSQAIALVDADGDGKLDIVASSDVPTEAAQLQSQIRVYLYRGAAGWEFKPGGISGGLFSNTLLAWDFDRDGKQDILTGSSYIGGLTLLWRNLGNGTFEPVRFPDVEVYSYHFGVAAGTFGKSRVPAFADNYYMITNQPAEARATGITVYSREQDKWVKHRVWRKKSGTSAQYAIAMGDLDGDGLDDIVFPDSQLNRLRVFFQKPDGTFVEMAENEEPALDSPGQCVRLVDVDRDGRLDIILSRTVVSYRGNEKGGFTVFLNKR